MRFRILCSGVDFSLLATRRALLDSHGYESFIATPGDVDEKIQSGRFDLVILSAMLSEEEKRRIQGEIPDGTKVLVLESLVLPKELLGMVASALAVAE
jgi:DNA-binding response OmpR family regulator